MSRGPSLGREFGANLRRSRRRADLSQQELAELVEMQRASISELERGRRLPRIDTILKLAAATEVPVCALLDGIELPPGSKRESRN
jgi:transcriptional regulator with XRE-family HTH domain